ncbi:MAG: hypothetical protein NTX33_04730 [Propionibacteriales bacterium]|nr:hypothetical protein [Propionibacteriales bacterium]
MTYDNEVAALLRDGWQHGERPVGLLVAVGAWVGAPERSVGGRFKPGSRLPWSGEATGFRIEFERDVRRWHAEACDEVFGHPVRAGGIAQMLAHLGTIIEKVDPALCNEVLKHLKNYHRRALVLLQEARPLWRLPLSCPDCHAADRLHMVMAERSDVGIKRIWCTGCEAEWTVSDLRFLDMTA